MKVITLSHEQAEEVGSLRNRSRQLKQEIGTREQEKRSVDSKIFNLLHKFADIDLSETTRKRLQHRSYVEPELSDDGQFIAVVEKYDL
ncbi:MAG: hypothetical protein AAB897_01275 [Patescibacteria group bacterium]